MNIDWFTFVSQIVNFLILVVALKFLLYDRLVSAMQKRNESISEKFDEAEKRTKEADERKSKYEEKLEELEEQRDEEIARAREEASRRKSELLDEARSEVEDRRRGWMNALDKEREDIAGVIRNRVTEQVFETARTVMRELADTDLESRVAGKFIKRLEDLDEENRKELIETADDGNEPLRVRSAFHLSGDPRERIESVLRGIMPNEVRVEFERSPDILFGVELLSSGSRISWSAGSQLDRLQEATNKLLSFESGEELSHDSDTEAAKGGDDEPGGEASGAPSGGDQEKHLQGEDVASGAEEK